MDRRTLLTIGLAAIAARPALAAQASIKAPAGGKAGWSISVAWSGPRAKGDSITIAPRGAKPGFFFNNCWARATDSPVRLKLPLTAGRYEVRYVSGEGAGARILARSPLTISDGAVAVAAPGTVSAGAEFRVDYRGPADFSDYVTITDPGDGELSTDYGYTRTNGYDHVNIRAPDAAGSYEVRYVVDADEIAVLGRTTIVVL